MTTQFIKPVPYYNFTFYLDTDYYEHMHIFQQKIKCERQVSDSTPQVAYNDRKPQVYIVKTRTLIPSHNNRMTS